MKGRQLLEISAQSGNFLNEPRIYYFIFYSKQKFSVLVSAAPTLYVFSKNEKNILVFDLKCVVFTAVMVAVYCNYKCVLTECTLSRVKLYDDVLF